jgi:two-component system sensor histidine kinase PilS (NtrC family)
VSPPGDEALRGRLRYLAVARIVFAVFVLGAALAVQLGWGESSEILQPLYGFTAAVFLLSIIYFALLPALPARTLAYAQVLGDAVAVTALIYISGGTDSIFSFLYFPVIIVAATLLYRPGGLLVASSCAICFGLLVDLQYHGIISPALATGAPSAASLLYKVVMHIAAFYIVAFLSAYLAEAVRTSASQLSAKQQEVDRLEMFNRYIVQSMASGLVTVDLDGRLTSMNRSAEQILGFRQEQVAGTPLSEVVPEVAGQLQAGQGEGVEEQARSELLYQRGDGVRLSLGFSVSPLLDGEGRMIGQVVIFRDLTQLRQMEDRLRQLDRLAAVGELAAGIAHEIRNPLASISGGVQMLQTEPEISSDNRRLLDIIVREAKRLNGLVEDFLLFARPGRRPRQRLDLTQTVTEALEVLGGHPGVRGRVRIERELEEGLWLNASPEEMRQVLANLLHNALEAMPEGGTLKVEAASSGGRVRLRVTDTGQGIGREDLSRIFSPFFTRKEHGTGLGLSIVHAIVDHHGGRIEVVSRPGQTTFTVWLPAESKQEGARLAA